MRIERSEDGDEDPSQKPEADLPKDTGRSEEVPTPGDVGRSGDAAPDNSSGESPEIEDAEVRRAESRTRSEYADHVAPPGSTPIEEDSPRSGAQEPSHLEDEQHEAMPSGHRYTERADSAEEPDKQRTEEDQSGEQSPAPDASAASGGEQRSPGEPTRGPAQSDNDSTAPSDEHEEPDDVLQTESSRELDEEPDADPARKPDDARQSPAVDDPDSPLLDTQSAEEGGRDTDLEPELTPSAEPNEESQAEGPPATKDSDQDTSEIDEPARPLTDREWAEHLTEVRDGLDWARRHGLQTHRLYTIDPDKREWSAERNRLQSELVSEMYEQAQEVPCDQRAIIAGGLGGAGKTTVLTEHANIELSNYLVINPDDIKEEMARRGMIPQINSLSPMEASDLAHEESSYIAKRLAMRAMADGRNLIWDITMSSEDSTKERINNLHSSGYDHIEGLFVDIPIETSVTRIDARHREGNDRYRAGQGLGGRFVPEEVVRNQEDPEWGSQNRRTFERVKSNLDTWSIYDNSVDGRSPIRVESSSGQHRNT
jgi:predicted ABC-type ATPase